MRRRRQVGYALILTAGIMVVLVGMMGFGIDMGVLRYDKRLQQTAADAAALAGASNLDYTGVDNAAYAAATADGFTDSGGNSITSCGSTSNVGTVCVQVNNPPADATVNGTTVLGGPHAGDSNYVEAIVAAVHPTYFMKVFGVNQQTIVARAVATSLRGNANNAANGCLFSLGTPIKGIYGVSANGNPTVYGPSCGIIDNGGLCTNGAVNITAGSIGVSGAWGGNGNSCQGGTVTPTPVTGMPAAGDPISITAPCSGSGCTSGPQVKITNGGCTSGNGKGKGSGSGSCPTGVTCDGTGNCSIQAGNYSDICITGSTINFGPGLYVINGSSTCNSGTEFSVTGNATICNSTSTCSAMEANMDVANAGVTFYLTGSGTVNIDGTTNVELAAPNSGTYEGLLFDQDSADTAAPSLLGNSNSNYQGSLYFPTALLTFGGNSGTTLNAGATYTLIVADGVTFSGNATVDLNSNYSGLSGNGGPLAGAISSARLVE